MVQNRSDRRGTTESALEWLARATALDPEPYAPGEFDEGEDSLAHLSTFRGCRWQMKQFAAARQERAWAATAQLLAARPRDFAAMVMLNEFATEAPAYALKISNLPGSFEPTPAWR